MAVADTMAVAVAVSFIGFGAIIRSHQEIQWSVDVGLGGTFPPTLFKTPLLFPTMLLSCIPPFTCPNSPVPPLAALASYWLIPASPTFQPLLEAELCRVSVILGRLP